MGGEAFTLLAEALSLPDSDRAELAAELLASLDQPATESQQDIDRLWAIEIERRTKKVIAGEARCEPWDKVRTRIERDLATGDSSRGELATAFKPTGQVRTPHDGGTNSSTR